MKTVFSTITRNYASMILNRFDLTLIDIEKQYREPHRHFHTCNHINEMMEMLYRLDSEDETFLEVHELETLIIAILFHDILYFPWKTDNEEASVNFLKDHLLDKSQDVIVSRACGIILETKRHTKINHPFLSEILNGFDTAVLRSNDFSKLIRYEHDIFKEFSFLPIDVYINKRTEFLEKYKETAECNLSKLIEYVKNRNYNIAVYPGSFNPFHIGHLEILNRASSMFDKVIIVVGVNSEKKNIEKLESISNVETLKPYEIIETDGNIIKEIFMNGTYAKYNPVLVRGLRNSSDLSYEESYITFCKELHPSLRFCFVMSSKELSYISSSAIRNLKNVSPDLYVKYIVK